jgi:ABC-type phosphate transport system substrate-binding protein
MDKKRLGWFVRMLIVSVAMALFASQAASASIGPECSGANIEGVGSALQKLQQSAGWNPDFSTSGSGAACAGSQGNGEKPIVGYSSIGSVAGLEDWGVDGHAFDAGPEVAFVGTDEPPNERQMEEIEAYETPRTREVIESIPVLQLAVAVIVRLPDGCTATSAASPGRLVLDNTTLERIYRGAITTWGEITDGGDTLDGVGCAEDPITPVVREDLSGVTRIFKRYLGLIDLGALETEQAISKTWNELSEGEENTVWPVAAQVVRPPEGGGEALAAQVAQTPGSIGYVSLASARGNASFTPPEGGADTSTFWVELQNNGLGQEAATYADPSTDGEAEMSANANCESELYTNGENPLPPSVEATWNEVSTSTGESNYPLCGLTYDLAFRHYSLFPGTTEGEATTVNNYLSFVLNAEPEGGQTLIDQCEYAPLPAAILLTAQAGVEQGVAFGPAGVSFAPAALKPQGQGDSGCDPKGAPPPPKLTCTFPYCEPTITSGVRISGEKNKDERFLCTAGPMMVSGNKKYLLTAGHCFEKKDGERLAKQISTAVESQYPNEPDKEKPIGSKGYAIVSDDYDTAQIEIAETKMPPWTNGASLPAVMVEWEADAKTKGPDVAGEAASNLGEENCFEGSVTSVQDCGEVFNVGIKAKVSGKEISNLDEFAAEAQGGDSGGPVFTRNGAREIIMHGTLVGAGQGKTTQLINANLIANGNILYGTAGLFGSIEKLKKDYPGKVPVSVASGAIPSGTKVENVTKDKDITKVEMTKGATRKTDGVTVTFGYSKVAVYEPMSQIKAEFKGETLLTASK